MTVAIAFVMAAVTLLPLMAEARHDASAASVHADLRLSGHDHVAGHQEADELVHHAQSHAQCVMPADARAPADAPSCTVQSFAVAHEADRAGGDAKGPYEPPRG
ncbi:hypothetical protein GOFOIKOB_0033 [Methylobacterium tardum]|uniref:UrcA family protein n=1 Tax=Methylobacterium tardum TaxID=374432 RepID=A0AA37TI95_9HYPH|nr:hypothetical protein [Methylobacterium tardum]URD36617.1 hypothetical protein M6G65_30515 [Methylobacterium tardum]GJE47014.1 hypothetical protein GOFOIKOB_0033 [Methylobacterium tardum]GLS71614.1 hypothetical protein GCM10007890_36270 [Methylobacterium tardum]